MLLFHDKIVSRRRASSIVMTPGLSLAILLCFPCQRSQAHMRQSKIASPAQPTRQISELVVPGIYSGWTGPGGKQGWLGLFCHRDEQGQVRSSSLRQCVCSVGKSKRVSDPDADLHTFGMGRRVSFVPGGDDLLFAVQRVGGLHAGKVVTCFFGKDQDAQTVTPLALGGKRYLLTQKDAIGGRAEMAFQGGEIDLQCGATKQIFALTPLKNQNDIAVLWAGDLDGDGKMDLFVRQKQKGYQIAYTLFLSSRASQTGLVGEAAAGGGRMVESGDSD